MTTDTVYVLLEVVLGQLEGIDLQFTRKNRGLQWYYGV